MSEGRILEMKRSKILILQNDEWCNDAMKIGEPPLACLKGSKEQHIREVRYLSLVQVFAVLLYGASSLRASICRAKLYVALVASTARIFNAMVVVRMYAQPLRAHENTLSFTSRILQWPVISSCWCLAFRPSHLMDP